MLNGDLWANNSNLQLNNKTPREVIIPWLTLHVYVCKRSNFTALVFFLQRFSSKNTQDPL